MPAVWSELNDLIPVAKTPLVGDVTEFDEPRGLGVISFGAGRHLSFHCTAITNGTRQIDVGTVVAFEVGAGRLGRMEAHSVRPLPGVVPPGASLDGDAGAEDNGARNDEGPLPAEGAASEPTTTTTPPTTTAGTDTGALGSASPAVDHSGDLGATTVIPMQPLAYQPLVPDPEAATGSGSDVPPSDRGDMGATTVIPMQPLAYQPLAPDPEASSGPVPARPPGDQADEMGATTVIPTQPPAYGPSGSDAAAGPESDSAPESESESDSAPESESSSPSSGSVAGPPEADSAPPAPLGPPPAPAPFEPPPAAGDAEPGGTDDPSGSPDGGDATPPYGVPAFATSSGMNPGGREPVSPSVPEVKPVPEPMVDELPPPPPPPTSDTTSAGPPPAAATPDELPPPPLPSASPEAHESPRPDFWSPIARSTSGPPPTWRTPVTPKSPPPGD
jgi:cold shock CspA family protein